LIAFLFTCCSAVDNNVFNAVVKFISVNPQFHTEYVVSVNTAHPGTDVPIVNALAFNNFQVIQSIRGIVLSTAEAGHTTSHEPAEVNSNAVSQAFTLRAFKACHVKLAGVSPNHIKVAEPPPNILIAISQFESRTNFNCSRSSLVRILNSSCVIIIILKSSYNSHTSLWCKFFFF